MSSVALDTPKILSFFQEFSPNVNGTVPFTNTSITPYFVSCFNGFIDPIVSKFNNNGTSILQSCVLDASCQKAKGCSAICGKIPGDSHVLTFKSDLDEDQNRRLRITAYNVLNPKIELDLEVIKSSDTDGFKISSSGKTSFKSDLSQGISNEVKTQLHGLALIGIAFGLAVLRDLCAQPDRP